MQKKNTLILSTLLIVALMISSCRKYEEGPGVSFIPKKSRVSNEWAFASVIENDVDVTADYHMATLNLTRSGSADFDYFEIKNGTKTAIAEQGEWEFDQDKTHISLILDGVNGTYRMGFRILELKNNSMHLQSEELNKDWKLISNNRR